MSDWIPIAVQATTLLRRAVEVGRSSQNKTMISPTERKILESSIRLHRFVVQVPCSQRAWEDGLGIIRSDNTVTISPVITPPGIELNKQIVCFGNIVNLFKYIGVGPEDELVRQFLFSHSVIQERKEFVVGGSLVRGTNEGLEANSNRILNGIAKPGLMIGRSGSGLIPDLDKDIPVDDTASVPALPISSNHYVHRLIQRGYVHLNGANLYHPDATWNMYMAV